MAKVYVASSWSNEYQPRIVAFLRERGHEVYDFRNPERKTDFRWSQISGNWEKMETDEYLDALEHPLAEAGWMKGAGKKVIVYRRPQRPELMYNLFDGIFPTDVARFLKEFDEMNNHAVVCKHSINSPFHSKNVILLL